MKLLLKITLILFTLSITLFARDVATITALSGKAFIERNGTKIEIALGTTLEEKDTVITDDMSKVQIIFSDQTIISLGKNSHFSISEYLFEENHEPTAKFAMLKGAMRTITGEIGKVAPQKFSVEAKTATIGIRGTNFSVVVNADESVHVYCTFGAISVSISGSENTIHQGFYIVISPEGQTEIKEFSSEELKEMQEKNFAKSKAKQGIGSEDVIVGNQNQLENTKEEFKNIVIRDISDSFTDSLHIESGELLPTDPSIIAGYAMSNAFYAGTYATTSNTIPDFSNSGVAKLEVNFGNDFVKLILLEPMHYVPSIIYIGNDSIHNGKFNAETEPSNPSGSGTANGTFYGPTGNTVKGDFNFIPSNPQPNEQASGTFEVISSDKLH